MVRSLASDEFSFPIKLRQDLTPFLSDEKLPTKKILLFHNVKTVILDDEAEVSTGAAHISTIQFELQDRCSIIIRLANFIGETLWGYKWSNVACSPA